MSSWQMTHNHFKLGGWETRTMEENKETIISMIVIRDFKLGRDSTKEKNIEGDHVGEGKSRT